MKVQTFRESDQEIVRAFIRRRTETALGETRLRFGWSNWGFGIEPLQHSAARLERHGIRWIELHGNLYGSGLGYRADEVERVLSDHGISVSGVCGMVSPESELAHISPVVRSRAIDYFRRHAEFTAAVGGEYLLFGAGSVGRPTPFDDFEMERAAETLLLAADAFTEHGVKGAIEPIRPEECSVVRTFADAERMIGLVDHPAIQWINGDLYHMLSGEQHIGTTIMEYGQRLLNLHLADTNRRALGSGLLDLDIVIMALYAVGYETRGYASAEPLGAGGNPYDAMNLPPKVEQIEDLVRTTATTWRDREQAILGATDEELSRNYQLEG
ncbi:MULTISPECIES: sugar phosphate isomerase/epimerase family protein [Microbacterium]|uniref:sugar phosphate isomerase/epimerase family protein n=1 Tax=Microbacterium TaxID=33882 RepID=UPI0020BE9047|nr:sugar phosphate isomerase/epimerase family protein [Microbacterium aurugineum]MCK8475853.1 sugar phosphate isomerase/epimerase [Microbacterium aurugineum]